MALTHEERIDPNLPNFAARFYPHEDSPEWRALREDLRMTIRAYALEEQDPTIYEAFITCFLLPNVMTSQTPAQLQQMWKSYFDGQDTSQP